MKTTLYVLWQIFLRIFLFPTLVTVGFWLFGVNPIGVFIIAFAFNFMIGTAYNVWVSSKLKKLELETEKAFIEMRDNQSLQVPCAYCGTKNVVPLNLTIGSFKCDQCKKINRLYLNFRSVRITDDVTGGGVMQPVENTEPTVTTGSI